MTSSTGESLARSSAVMAAGTITSRVLGMVRGVLLAATLGTELTGSTFAVANTLPNQFYILLAGGVLNAILVPQIAKAASHADGGEVFVNRLLTLAIAIMAGATVMLTLAAPLLVRIFATSSWSPQAIRLTVAFAFICLPQIFFYGLYTLLGQVLNAKSHFAAYMWAPVLANLVAMAGLLVYLSVGFPRRGSVDTWTPQMIWLIAGTSTLGVVAQALALVPPLRRIGFRYRPVWGFRGVGLGSASKVALWTFAALGVGQLGFVVTSQVLTHADAVAHVVGVQGAGNAVYGPAFLIFMLPHSLVTVSLVTALFTRLSMAAHEGRVADVVKDLGRGLRMPAVLLIPATFAGALLATHATRVLFLGTSLAGTHAIGQISIAMLLGLVPFGWVYLIQRVFYSYEDARTPFYLQIVITVVATIANLISATLPAQWVGVGVGVGQTVSNLLAAGVGFWLLRRKLGPLHLSPIVRQYVRLTLASAVAAAVTWVLLRALTSALGASWSAAVVELVAAGGVFVVIALGLARLMRVREVSELLDPVLRRVRRNRG